MRRKKRMIRNGLTITMVFDAASANYGEGIGNISQLKKMTRTGGQVYTYISRQALRYSIVQQMGIDHTPVTIDPGVVQFAPEAQITDFPEIDLFGYMKTSKSKEGQNVRSAVVRLSNAISVEPYKSDVDFLNNMGLAQRDNLQNTLAQSEIHKSLYTYTLNVDLDKVGIDERAKIEIPKEQRCERVIKLLETVEFLWRDIRGRRENLNPVLAVGGLYERKNPYFEDRIKITGKGNLDVDLLVSVIDSCEDTRENTVVGCLPGIFLNNDEIKEKLKVSSVNEMFVKIKEEVNAYYG